MLEKQKQILWVDMYNAFQSFSKNYKKDILTHLKDINSSELITMVLNKPGTDIINNHKNS